MGAEAPPGGPAHHAGARFCNPWPVAARPWLAAVRAWLARPRRAWRALQPTPPGPAPPPEITEEALRVTFVGHASVLLQWAGTNALVDPIWSRRAGPLPWLGLRRRQPPGVRFADLPPIHAVLLTHDHHDHCDLPTLRRLVDAHGPRIVAPAGMRRWLAGRGVRDVVEMDWWEQTELPGATVVTCVPAQHTSGRAPWSRRRHLWAGFVCDGPAGRVYVAGDTGVGPHLATIAERFPAPRLAVLPIGCYLPARCMAPLHLSPADALALHRQLDAGTSLGVHYGTFPQAGDGPSDAMDALGAALDADDSASPPRFWTLATGEGRNVP